MKTVLPVLLAVSLIFTSRYEGSTLSSVVMSGGIIKAQNTSVDKKYPRKDCPICKGTGKYLSGDGIKMVDCGYCEPPKTKDIVPVTVPPVKIQPLCPGSNCPPQRIYRK
jgi:hypothetical protein